MSKKVIAIIPARMAASRFPGKPLAKIADLPMIEHVRRRVGLSKVIDEVYVATCDQEIINTVEHYGGKAIMTKNTHQRCTDRVQEAMAELNADIVIIVQGDEPLLDPAVLEKLVNPIKENNNIQCANALSLINSPKDLSDIDIVKAVINNNSFVMYYSRAAVPYSRVKNYCLAYRQTGLSAFTKEFLKTFSSLPQTSKEIAESVDFMRIIDHGYKILAVVYSQRTIGVDRESDIPEIENILEEDGFQNKIYQKILREVINTKG